MDISGKRIMVVDDDPDIGAMLKMMLEFRGYSPIVIEKADKVKKTMEDNPVHLIILDMLLSGINGTEICAALKANDLTRRIPIIMISAHPNAKELCEQAGANSFLAKPFDMHEILERIDTLLKVETT